MINLRHNISYIKEHDNLRNIKCNERTARHSGVQSDFSPQKAPMRKDSRLSRMLHVLVHMHHQTNPLTSDQIALMLHTNPVVVRRTMAILKAEGFVSSGKGHGGGWQLATPLAQITLLDIHKALKEGSLFTIGLTDEHDQCPIEHAVNHAIDDVLQAAEALVLERFSQVTLDSLASDYPPDGKLS